jgi:hypothetical protein
MVVMQIGVVVIKTGVTVIRTKVIVIETTGLAFQTRVIVVERKVNVAEQGGLRCQQKGKSVTNHIFAGEIDIFTIKVYKFDSSSLSQTATCTKIVFI